MDIVGTDTKRVLIIRYKLLAMYNLCSKCIIITFLFFMIYFNWIHSSQNSCFNNLGGVGSSVHICAYACLNDTAQGNLIHFMRLVSCRSRLTSNLICPSIMKIKLLAYKHLLCHTTFNYVLILFPNLTDFPKRVLVKLK